MNELKITKERVLEAAGKCAQAKETLKTLFPEAFTEESAFKGFVWVEPRNPCSYKKGRYLAAARAEVLKILRDDYPRFNYTTTVVLVLTPDESNPEKINGYPFSDWKTFNEEWKIIK